MTRREGGIGDCGGSFPLNGRTSEPRVSHKCSKLASEGGRFEVELRLNCMASSMMFGELVNRCYGDSIRRGEVREVMICRSSFVPKPWMDRHTEAGTQQARIGMNVIFHLSTILYDFCMIVTSSLGYFGSKLTLVRRNQACSIVSLHAFSPLHSQTKATTGNQAALLE